MLFDVNFGTGKGNLSTVGYTLYAASGGTPTRVTTGVTERVPTIGGSPFHTGIYYVDIALGTIRGFKGTIFWDTGEGASSAVAEEAINLAAVDNFSEEEALRLMLAALAGTASGMNINNPIFMSTDGATQRIQAHTDSNGNRSAITLTAT